jgi:hypothetical protein
VHLLSITGPERRNKAKTGSKQSQTTRRKQNIQSGERPSFAQETTMQTTDTLAFKITAFAAAILITLTVLAPVFATAAKLAA